MFHSTSAILPQMISRKEGSIVNVSSMWGICGASCEVHYSASKAAIIGATKALAKELAPSNIRVNCVAPGAVETDMNSNLTPGRSGTIERRNTFRKHCDRRRYCKIHLFSGVEYIVTLYYRADFESQRRTCNLNNNLGCSNMLQPIFILQIFNSVTQSRRIFKTKF